MNVPIPLKKAKINSALQAKSGRASHCQSAFLICRLNSIQFVFLYSTFLHERSMPMFHKLPPIKAATRITIPQNTITAPRIFITIGAGAAGNNSLNFGYGTITKMIPTIKNSIPFMILNIFPIVSSSIIYSKCLPLCVHS